MGYLTRATPLQMPDMIKDLKEDKIQIGYIDGGTDGGTVEQIEVVDELTQLKEQVQILKLKRELKELQTDLSTETSGDNKHFKDCVAALVSLGEKKADAKRKTSKIFKDNPDITVDEFISKAYQS